MKIKLKRIKPRPRFHADMRNTMLKIWAELDDQLRVGLMQTYLKKIPYLQYCYPNQDTDIFV